MTYISKIQHQFGNGMRLVIIPGLYNEIIASGENGFIRIEKNKLCTGILHTKRNQWDRKFLDKIVNRLGNYVGAFEFWQHYKYPKERYRTYLDIHQDSKDIEFKINSQNAVSQFDPSGLLRVLRRNADDASSTHDGLYRMMARDLNALETAEGLYLKCESESEKDVIRFFNFMLSSNEIKSESVEEPEKVVIPKITNPWDLDIPTFKPKEDQ